MVEIIRTSGLPKPNEVPVKLREAASSVDSVVLRERRPIGLPLLFTSDMQLIEPAVAFLHEHLIQRAHTADTLRTYAEVLFDWFDALEQSQIAWCDADAADLVAYRNRMLLQPSAHTGRRYSVRTINLRVRGVMRFYEWAVRNTWLNSSELIGHGQDFSLARNTHHGTDKARAKRDEQSFFQLRQFETLPRPLTGDQARELLSTLVPPYDLMARWQLYTGLRVSELLRLSVNDVNDDTASPLLNRTHRFIDVLRKGRKDGYVIASASLLEETTAYLSHHRHAWLNRAKRRHRVTTDESLFIGSRGTVVKKNSYQKVISHAGTLCGFKATTHLLRATFACMMLAQLERLAAQGVAINPLLIVKILMGHEHIETTDRYLRAIAVDSYVLTDALDSLLSEF